MDFHSLKRKELQALCKKHDIPANLTNREMADRLASNFKENDSSENSSTNRVEICCEKEAKVAKKQSKKVRFSSESDNQTFEYQVSVYPKTKRATRQTLSKNPAQVLENAPESEVIKKLEGCQLRVTRSRVQNAVKEDINTASSPPAGRKRGRGGKKSKDAKEVEDIGESESSELGTNDVRNDTDVLCGRQLRSRRHVTRGDAKKLRNGKGGDQVHLLLDESSEATDVPKQQSSRNVEVVSRVTRQSRVLSKDVASMVTNDVKIVAVKEGCEAEKPQRRSKRTSEKDCAKSATSAKSETEVTKVQEQSERDIELVEPPECLRRYPSRINSVVSQRSTEENKEELLKEESKKRSRTTELDAIVEDSSEVERVKCAVTSQHQASSRRGRRNTAVLTAPASELENKEDIAVISQHQIPLRRGRRKTVILTAPASELENKEDIAVTSQHQIPVRRGRRKTVILTAPASELENQEDTGNGTTEKQRKSSQNCSRYSLSGTPKEDPVLVSRNDQRFKNQTQEPILEEEKTSAREHHPPTQKHQRRSSCNTSISATVAPPTPTARDVEKEQQSKSTMAIVEEEAAPTDNLPSPGELPTGKDVLVAVSERAGNEYYLDVDVSKQVVKNGDTCSNERGKGLRKNSEAEKQRGFAESSPLFLKMEECKDSSRNMEENLIASCVKLVGPSTDLEVKQSGQGSVAIYEKESNFVEDAMEKLVPGGNIESEVTCMSSQTVNTTCVLDVANFSDPKRLKFESYSSHGVDSSQITFPYGSHGKGVSDQETKEDMKLTDTQSAHESLIVYKEDTTLVEREKEMEVQVDAAGSEMNHHSSSWSLQQRAAVSDSNRVKSRHVEHESNVIYMDEITCQADGLSDKRDLTGATSTFLQSEEELGTELAGRENTNFASDNVTAADRTPFAEPRVGVELKDTEVTAAESVKEKVLNLNKFGEISGFKIELEKPLKKAEEIMATDASTELAGGENTNFASDNLTAADRTPFAEPRVGVELKDTEVTVAESVKEKVLNLDKFGEISGFKIELENPLKKAEEIVATDASKEGLLQIQNSVEASENQENAAKFHFARVDIDTQKISVNQQSSYRNTVAPGTPCEPAPGNQFEDNCRAEVANNTGRKFFDQERSEDPNPVNASRIHESVLMCEDSSGLVKNDEEIRTHYGYFERESSPSLWTGVVENSNLVESRMVDFRSSSSKVVSPVVVSLANIFSSASQGDHPGKSSSRTELDKVLETLEPSENIKVISYDMDAEGIRSQDQERSEDPGPGSLSCFKESVFIYEENTTRLVKNDEVIRIHNRYIESKCSPSSNRTRAVDDSNLVESRMDDSGSSCTKVVSPETISLADIFSSATQGDHAGKSSSRMQVEKVLEEPIENMKSISYDMDAEGIRTPVPEDQQRNQNRNPGNASCIHESVLMYEDNSTRVMENNEDISIHDDYFESKASSRMELEKALETEEPSEIMKSISYNMDAEGIRTPVPEDQIKGKLENVNVTIAESVEEVIFNDLLNELGESIGLKRGSEIPVTTSEKLTATKFLDGEGIMPTGSSAKDEKQEYITEFGVAAITGTPNTTEKKCISSSDIVTRGTPVGLVAKSRDKLCSAGIAVSIVGSEICNQDMEISLVDDTIKEEMKNEPFPSLNKTNSLDDAWVEVASNHDKMVSSGMTYLANIYSSANQTNFAGETSNELKPEILSDLEESSWTENVNCRSDKIEVKEDLSSMHFEDTNITAAEPVQEIASLYPLEVCENGDTKESEISLRKEEETGSDGSSVIGTVQTESSIETNEMSKVKEDAGLAQEDRSSIHLEDTNITHSQLVQEVVFSDHLNNVCVSGSKKESEESLKKAELTGSDGSSGKRMVPTESSVGNNEINEASGQKTIMATEWSQDFQGTIYRVETDVSNAGYAMPDQSSEGILENEETMNTEKEFVANDVFDTLSENNSQYAKDKILNFSDGSFNNVFGETQEKPCKVLDGEDTYPVSPEEKDICNKKLPYSSCLPAVNDTQEKSDAVCMDLKNTRTEIPVNVLPQLELEQLDIESETQKQGAESGEVNAGTLTQALPPENLTAPITTESFSTIPLDHALVDGEGNASGERVMGRPFSIDSVATMDGSGIIEGGETDGVEEDSIVEEIMSALMLEHSDYSGGEVDAELYDTNMSDTKTIEVGVEDGEKAIGSHQGSLYGDEQEDVTSFSDTPCSKHEISTGSSTPLCSSIPSKQIEEHPQAMDDINHGGSTEISTECKERKHLDESNFFTNMELGLFWGDDDEVKEIVAEAGGSNEDGKAIAECNSSEFKGGDDVAITDAEDTKFSVPEETMGLREDLAGHDAAMEDKSPLLKSSENDEVVDGEATPAFRTELNLLNGSAKKETSNSVPVKQLISSIMKSKNNSRLIQRTPKRKIFHDMKENEGVSTKRSQTGNRTTPKTSSKLRLPLGRV